MDALYWLIFIISASAIGIYAHYWYHRPSGMSEVQKVSYSYDSLEYIDFYVRLQGESSEKYGIRKENMFPI